MTPRLRVRVALQRVCFATMYGVVYEWLLLPTIAVAHHSREDSNALSLAWWRWRVVFYVERRH